MARTAPVGDPRAVADAILRVLEAPADFRGVRAEVQALFDPNRTVRFYEDLFEELLARP